jgi:hypothetical protein
MRLGDCHMTSQGWGALTLAAAAPRSAVAWTSGGTSHDQRDLKHRPAGTVRPVPIPPVLVRMLRTHLRCHGTAPDGRLFRHPQRSAQRIGRRTLTIWVDIDALAGIRSSLANPSISLAAEGSHSGRISR